MKLSNEQQWVIEHRLNALVDRLGDEVPAQTRSSLIERLRKRIYDALESLEYPVEEADIDYAVANCLRPGNSTPPPRPATPASTPLPTPATDPAVLARRTALARPAAPLPSVYTAKAVPAPAPTQLEDTPWMAPRKRAVLALNIEDARWLGVCAGIAGWLGIYPSIIRLFFLILGFTGPLAVALYLLFYAEMYFRSPDAPRFDWIAFAKRLFGFVGALFILYEGSVGAWFGSLYLLERYAAVSPATLKPWNWMGGYLNEPMFLAVVLLSPLAILSGMPMINEWDKTLRRMAQAGLALYGVFVSLGLASLLCGIILHFVRQAATWGR